MTKAAKSTGPILVVIASLLWASDAIFRVPLSTRYSPIWIVFMEHLIAFGLLALLVLPFAFKEIRSLSRKDWLAAGVIGVGASALATLFFTASYRYVNPSVALLLQKLQPVFVSVLAFAILGERPSWRYWLWAPIALIAATMVVLPEIDFKLIATGLDIRSRGVIYALAATLIWATATILAKALLSHVSFMALTTIRYGFGLATLAVLIPITGIPYQLDILIESHTAMPFLYMALFPGLFAMVAYYSGLKQTPASITTYLELVYPVGGALLNFLILGISLNFFQIAGSAILILAVLQLSRDGR